MTPANANRPTVRAAGEVVRRSGTSFYWAMRLLPEPQRSAMFAIYAFCRAVDDVADGLGAVDTKKAQLKEWRRRIEALYDGSASTGDELTDLAVAIDRFSLAKVDFLTVVDGMETDAAEAVRMADETALDAYIDQVAGSVGRLSCRVFGLPEGIHRPLSEALGNAFQVTNILRDLREDAGRDRIYLPQSSLVTHGLDGLTPSELLSSRRLEAVCRPMADAARSAYAEADRLMAACDGKAVKPARMMRAAYGRLFDKVADAGFSPLPEERISLGRREKLAIMLRHGLF